MPNKSRHSYCAFGSIPWARMLQALCEFGFCALRLELEFRTRIYTVLLDFAFGRLVEIHLKIMAILACSEN